MNTPPNEQVSENARMFGTQILHKAVMSENDVAQFKKCSRCIGILDPETNATVVVYVNASGDILFDGVKLP